MLWSIYNCRVRKILTIPFVIAYNRKKEYYSCNFENIDQFIEVCL